MQIDEIKIENFKGIKELVVSNLSYVNVFIGKNNSNKTSCLEALGSFFSTRYFSTKTSPPPTFLHHNKKGEQFAGAKVSITFKLPTDYFTKTANPYFSNNNFDDARIDEIKTLVGEKITVSKNNFNENNDPGNFRATYQVELESTFPSHLRNPFEDVVAQSLRAYYQGQNCVQFITAIDGYKINYDIGVYYQQVYGDGTNPNQFLRSGIKGIFSQLSNLLNSDDRYKADSFIERIKNLYKEFPRFHVRSGSAVIELGEKEKLKSIPFYSQGNGQIETLELFWLFDELSSEGQQKCRIYLMDEPENHKHPSLQREVLKRVTKTAEETNAQFFITTHSPVFASQYRNPNVRVYVTNKDEDNDLNTAKLIINPTVAQEAKAEIGLLNIDNFFQDVVLFVEGDMEAVIAPALFRFFGTDEELLAIKIRNVQSNDNVSLSRLKETLEIIKDTAITPMVILDNENNATQNRDDIKRSYVGLFKNEIQYKLWTSNLINCLPEKIVLEAFNKMLADKAKPPIDQTLLNSIKGSNLEKGLEKHYYETTQGSLKPALANFIAQEILNIPAAEKKLYENTEVFDHINKLVTFVNQITKRSEQ